MRNILLLTAFRLGAAVATAQTAPVQAPATHAARQPLTAAAPPEPTAREMTAQLKGPLGLSPAQTTRVYAAALACRQAYRAMLRRRETRGTGEPIAQEQHAIEAAYEARLNPVLTPEQATRYQAIQTRYRKLRAQFEAEEKTKK